MKSEARGFAKCFKTAACNLLTHVCYNEGNLAHLCMSSSVITQYDTIAYFSPIPQKCFDH